MRSSWSAERYRFIVLLSVCFYPRDSNSVLNASKVPQCLVAKVLSGSTCHNLKVILDASQCGDTVEEVQTRCEGSKALAQLTKGITRYEARFIEVDGGWGEKNWNLEGSPVLVRIPKKSVGPQVNKVTTSRKWAKEEKKSASSGPFVEVVPGFSVPAVVKLVMPSNPGLKFSGYRSEFCWFSNGSRFWSMGGTKRD